MADAKMADQEHPGLEVFRIFLRLGLTSFGGPIAHLGYFRQEFVVKRKWIDEGAYADLVGLCQFLPGPASSQVGFALGVSRAGLVGGLAAWCGFTLPSAILLFAFAAMAASMTGGVAVAAVHGLKVVAVAVVAQAVLGMARTLTPDARRIAMALGSTLVVTAVAGSLGQISAILLGALAGMAICRNLAACPSAGLSVSVSRTTAILSLGAFSIILFAGPALSAFLGSHALAVFDAFYRSGALVFGGGHVVLPLLNDAVVRPGWISTNTFLTGYGAAQAVPGPLFTVSVYLGAMLNGPPNGWAGASIALAGIFLPGMLILIGVLPFWDEVRKRRNVQAAVLGINAAVVGILAAALYTPLWTSAIGGWRDVLLAAGGFLLLAVVKAPPWTVVGGITAAAILLAAG
jgi:chromate transporter